MSGLDRFLEPGEEVRFEGRTHGLAPVTPGAVALHSVILGTAGWALLAGVYHAPIARGLFSPPTELLALSLMLAIELYRIAEYRSWQYIVTTTRVLMAAGVFRTRIKYAVSRELLTGVQLLHEVPTLHLDAGRREAWALTGLDPLDHEAIAKALVPIPTLPPLPLSVLRRRVRRLILLLIVALPIVIAAEGAMQRRASGRFAAEWTRVIAAVRHAEAAFTTRAEADGFSIQRRESTDGWDMGVARFAQVHIQLNATDRARGRERVVWVRVHASHRPRLLPKTEIVVERRGQDREGDRVFFEELRRELKSGGFDPSWWEEAH